MLRSLPFLWLSISKNKNLSLVFFIEYKIENMMLGNKPHTSRATAPLEIMCVRAFSNQILFCW